MNPLSIPPEGSLYRLPLNETKEEKLLLQTELLRKGAIRALVGRFEVFQMLATIRNKAKKATTRALVFTILIQMCRKLFDAAG